MPKYYTGLGDNEISKIGSSNLSKSDSLLEVIGNLDELNSKLGTLIAFISSDQIGIYKLDDIDITDMLLKIQSKIFSINAELISTINPMFKPKSIVSESDTKELESAIGILSAKFPDINTFVLPGGSIEGALTDEARTLCRRCERSIARKFDYNSIANRSIFSYVNRLSSLLFVLELYINNKKGYKQIPPEY